MSDCNLVPDAVHGHRCSVCGWTCKRPARRNCPGAAAVAAAASALAPRPEAGPCPHRLAIVRQAECRACGQLGQLADVYGCAKHGECTLRRRGVEGAKNCLGCGDLPKESRPAAAAVRQAAAADLRSAVEAAS
ncbi:MAG TPA: hypothetical protein VGE52_07245 [Pirellulales bacterium]